MKSLAAVGLGLVLAFAAVATQAALPTVDSQGQSLPTLAPMLREVNPAVVNIATYTQQETNNPLLNDPFFRHFFNLPEQQQRPQRAPRQRQQSAGSGVIVNAKGGVVITNHHVINGADDIVVHLNDGRSFPAELVGSDPEVDIFDREQVFIEQILTPLTARLPQLKIVLEHITTTEAVSFVREAGDNIAATITAHHLLFNRNHMLVGGIRPHYYCLPILKRNTHQQALIQAATSGSPKFFLGTDSAPHARNKKEAPCGCAGAYTAYAAMEMYTEAFEDAKALDKLEAFTSFFGADFYGLQRNSATVTLRKEEWRAPESLPFGSNTLIPLRAGDPLRWKLISPSL